ncbi:hypothetical protein [Amycolatopsis sp. lyj-112]|uniref:hypothetical protein n=1 Tax=Amycolatopsis sp. lyj-112 TaxID=2789288 RepID=UPI00397B35EA
MTPSRDEEDLRLVAELTDFVEVYQAATGPEVSHEGWHAGARLWPGTEKGRLLVYHDSGIEAECHFREGERTLFNIMHSGYGVDTAERGFGVWSKRPGVLGAVAAGVSRLEVTGADGAVVPADIVGHTFAVDVDLGPEPRTVDEVFAPWEPPELTVRVYAEGDVVRYEGPFLT